jgi:hypothetical protein
VVALFVEPKVARTDSGQVATFGTATVIEACRSEKTGRWSEPVKLVFDEPGALWDEITGYTRVHGRTWVVGHGMGTQLRLAQAFKYLPRLGWTANPDVIISDTTVSIGWHREKLSLLAVDLFSYLPHDLPVIQARTKTFGEAEAIFDAFMDLISLQHDHDLGNFSRTGASNASNHFRHVHMQHRIFVHTDERALDAERDSIFTGRTEAHRWGTFRDLDEWDLPLAYPRVGLDTRLPVRLLGLRPRGSLLVTCLELVHALVECPVPVLPSRDHDGGITWPTGFIEGWYWQPELDLAAEYGCLITPVEQYVYEAAPVLESWARWVIDVVTKGGGHHDIGTISRSQPNDVTAPGFTAIQQMAVKHWGRALIGKFGAQVPNWGPYARFEGVDLEVSRTVMDGIPKEILTIGGRSLVAEGKTYADHAMPAIMSRVISECRMRLWKLMQVAGMDHVYYVDTDSLFTDHQGSTNLKAYLARENGWGLVLKRHHREVTIYGPRQLACPCHGLRVSGLPKNAQELEYSVHQTSTFNASVTESFRTGAQRGHAGEVVTRRRGFRLRGTDTRRVHLEGGYTEAMTA